MISKRIREIAKLIKNDETVCDIGCDHGYLAAILRQNGNEEHIICCDNKKGPLDNAKSNLVYYDNIEFVLSDGATNITTVVNTVVMAGMGYHNVVDIISASKDYFSKVKKLILQVNMDVDKLRKWLNDNEYKIVDEVILKEYKWYQILVVEHGNQSLTEDEIKFGPVLLNKKEDIYKEYLLDNKAKIEEILTHISDDNEDYQIKRNELDLIDRIISQF